MNYKQRWERFKNEMSEIKTEMKEHSEEIEFKKKTKRRPSAGVRTFLWASIVVNLVLAAGFAATIVLIPISIVQLIACIYVYQVYLRREDK